MTEVPTRRTDARLHRVLVVLLSINVVGQSVRFPMPVMLALWAVVAAGLVVVAVADRRESRNWTPVRATESGLRLPDGAGAAVAVDWADVVAVRFRRRRFLPHLTVEPVDADRVRPRPDRFQRAAALRDGRYQIDVALGGSRAERDRLRADLAARVPVA